MEYKDYYRILGVGRDAEQDEIRKAYRSLARKYHPDVNPGDKAAEERFKEINEAYEVLRDAEKRAKYDQLGADWQRYQQMGGDPGGFDWSQWFGQGQAGPRGQRVYTTDNIDMDDLFGQGGFSDFFQHIFGGGARMGGANPYMAGRTHRTIARDGRNLEQPVEISLEEAYHGCSRIMEMGDGRRLEVTIPPGVATGSRVRMAGEGEPGRDGGRSGDILLRITVREHPRFRRKGDDLYTELPVDLYKLVLGGTVAVNTIKGRVELSIPPETKAGQSFRLRGQGMPHLRNPSQHGDLYVEVQPIIPQGLTEREQELFGELRALRA